MEVYGTKKEKNWTKYYSSDCDNSKIFSDITTAISKGEIKEDVSGRLNKFFRYFEKHSIVISYISIINNSSRTGKIENFFSKSMNKKTPMAEIGISSYNYHVTISLDKNNDGITNNCTILKDGELYKEFILKDFNKDIQYIGRIIGKDIFTLDSFFDMLRENNKPEDLEYVDEMEEVMREKYKKILNKKWNTCRVRSLVKRDITVEFIRQRKNKIWLLYMKVHKTNTSESLEIRKYKSINKYPIEKENYYSFDDIIRIV